MGIDTQKHKQGLQKQKMFPVSTLAEMAEKSTNCIPPH